MQHLFPTLIRLQFNKYCLFALQAKDAMKLDEDSYDIYDPRNPLNKRRRETDKKKPKKTA